MKTQIRIFLLSLLMTGVIYPLIVTVFAQIAFNKTANGSLIAVDGKTVGSALLAQKFESDRYFWARPSANNYDPLASGGTNLSPTSNKLLAQVREREKGNKNMPKEMLFASGSGLDPDISLENALFQAERVAKARSFDLARVTGLVQINVKANPFGQSYVNVLELNVALDKL